MTAATLIRNLDDLPSSVRSGAVTIGNFDGVHVGHAALIERLIARAREMRGPAVVFTFDPHPAAVALPRCRAPTAHLDRAQSRIARRRWASTP